MNKTLSAYEVKDNEGVMLSVADGGLAPAPYVVSFGITTPKGDHANDKGDYLTWYKDGGFVVVVGLEKDDLQALIAHLQSLV